MVCRAEPAMKQPTLLAPNVAAIAGYLRFGEDLSGGLLGHVRAPSRLAAGE